jgi:hypothetical protein
MAISGQRATIAPSDIPAMGMKSNAGDCTLYSICFQQENSSGDLSGDLLKNPYLDLISISLEVDLYTGQGN